MVNPAIVIAALLTLAPFLAAAFFRQPLTSAADRLTAPVRLLAPALLCVPYLLVACATGRFRWGWLAVYALLPVAVAALMQQARRIDPEQRGNWRDFLVLAALGLAVDLRWFETRVAGASGYLQQNFAVGCGHLRPAADSPAEWSWI